MKPWARSTPDRYRRLPLYAHALLRDVPLHDVWEVWLPGGAPPEAPSLARVPEEVRRRSQPPSGGREGPFVLLYALDFESVSEIRNATVHAFSVLALECEDGGYRGTWAIHVAPVGRITRFYMALIDPFRRFLVYPAILGHVHRRWRETWGDGA